MKRIKVSTSYTDGIGWERWEDPDTIPKMIRDVMTTTRGMSTRYTPTKVVIHYEGDSGDFATTYEWAEYLPEPFPVGGPEPEAGS